MSDFTAQDWLEDFEVTVSFMSTCTARNPAFTIQLTCDLKPLNTSTTSSQANSIGRLSNTSSPGAGVSDAVARLHSRICEMEKDPSAYRMSVHTHC